MKAAPLIPDTSAGVFVRQLLALELAPHQPFYIVDAAAIGLNTTSSILGFHFKNLDLAAIEAIGDEWSGRGACVAINFSGIWKIARAIPHPSIQFNYTMITLGTLVHEVAHAVVAGLDRGSEPTPADAPRVLAINNSLRAAIAADASEPVDRQTHYPNHDDRFIRVLLHLLDRCGSHPEARFLPLRPDWVFDSAHHGLSNIRQYEIAIGDEPQMLRHLPLAEILKHPAPAEFDSLYSSDLAARQIQLPSEAEKNAA